jgi:uncharacterized protein (TIGR02246 family)
MRMAVSFAALLCVHASAVRSEDVRAAVEAGNRAFIAAILKGDAKAAAALYTEDAKLIAPSSEIASGRPAIAAAWQKVIDGGVKDLTLSTVVVESAGDLAYEDGLVKVVGRNDEVTTGRYVVVWKRRDGGWKLHRDIWN